MSLYNEGVFTLPAPAGIVVGNLLKIETGVIAKCGADGPGTIGVAVTPTTNATVGIRRASVGLSDVLAGGTITAGDLLACGAAGTVVSHTSETFVIGVAVTGGESGDLITAILNDTGVLYISS